MELNGIGFKGKDFYRRVREYYVGRSKVNTCSIFNHKAQNVSGKRVNSAHFSSTYAKIGMIHRTTPAQR